jgi:hypothetical protein
MAGQTATHKIEIIMGEMGTLNQYINTLESGFKRVADQISVINSKMQEAMKGGNAGQALSTGGGVMPPGAQQAVTGGTQVHYAASSMEKLGDVAKKLAGELDNVKQKQLDMISALSDATDAQKKIITQDLQSSQIKEREIKNLQSMMPGGGGGGGPLEALFKALGPLAAVGGAVKAAQFMTQIPVISAAARAAAGGLQSRDLAAMGGTSYEDMLRMNPEARREAMAGQTAGQMKSYAGWGLAGAGVGYGLAALLAPFTGGGSLALSAGFAGAGAAGGMGLAKMFGATEPAGASGWEDYMSKVMQRQGVSAMQYEGARKTAADVAFPLQFAYGIKGDEHTLTKRIYDIAGKTGMDPKAITNMMVGMGGFGSSAGAGGEYGNLGAFSTAGRITEAGVRIGQSPTDMFKTVGGFQGLGGMKSSTNEDINQSIDIIGKGVRLGIKDNSELMKQYLDVSATIMQSMGGGFGAGASGYTSNIMEAMVNSSPEGARGVGIQAAPTLQNIMSSLLGQRQGRGGLANIAGTAEAMQKLSAGNPAIAKLFGGSTSVFTQNLLAMSPQVGEAFLRSMPASERAKMGLPTDEDLWGNQVTSMMDVIDRSKMGKMISTSVAGGGNERLGNKFASGAALSWPEQVRSYTALITAGQDPTQIIRLFPAIQTFLKAGAKGDHVGGGAQDLFKLDAPDALALKDKMLQTIVEGVVAGKGMPSYRQQIDEKLGVVKKGGIDSLIKDIETLGNTKGASETIEAVTKSLIELKKAWPSGQPMQMAKEQKLQKTKSK